MEPLFSKWPMHDAAESGVGDDPPKVRDEPARFYVAV